MQGKLVIMNRFGDLSGSVRTQQFDASEPVSAVVTAVPGATESAIWASVPESGALLAAAELRPGSAVDRQTRARTPLEAVLRPLLLRFLFYFARRGCVAERSIAKATIAVSGAVRR